MNKEENIIVKELLNLNNKCIVDLFEYNFMIREDLRLKQENNRLMHKYYNIENYLDEMKNADYKFADKEKVIRNIKHILVYGDIEHED